MERKKRITSFEEARLRAQARAKDESIIENENKNVNSIGHSGNADVDLKVDVNIDTTAIGFAILSSLLATGQMSEEAFQIAVQRLEALTNKRMDSYFGHDENNVANVRIFNKKRK
ncbi:hypothetical protein J9303_15020 [Bacillaceae bacterium Marseille-Q3522]|nr:hypothetical protein [Bacillaceae bacterium Marseille-Q3522]